MIAGPGGKPDNDRMEPPEPSMRFSLRQLLMFVAVVGVFLALTRLPLLVTAGLLVLGVAVANFWVPIRVWRFAVYGGIAGIVFATVCLSAFVRVGFGEPIKGSRALQVTRQADPFLLPVGALLGCTAGLALGKRWSRSLRP